VIEIQFAVMVGLKQVRLSCTAHSYCTLILHTHTAHSYCTLILHTAHSYSYCTLILHTAHSYCILIYCILHTHTAYSYTAYCILILHTAYSYCIQDATSFIRGLPSSAAEAEREASRQKDRLSTVVDTTLIARNYQEISAIRARESLAMEADAR
jgi:hypothetical protein